MAKQKFSVKALVTEINEKGFHQTNLVSLGQDLNFQDAVALRKENFRSWTHPQNTTYPNATENLKPFSPAIVVKQPSVKKKRIRSK